MKYRIKKETKPTLATFGKYKAVAVHNQTISTDQIFEEASRNHPFDKGVFIAAMSRVAEVVNRHLREGEFRAKKHIRGVRLHFIPESYNGSQPLYKGIEFEKEKGL